MNRGNISAGLARIFLVGILVLTLGSPAIPQEAAPPATGGGTGEAAPASEMVEALVVLASKGERESTDARLAELAPILKAHFGGQFNVFRLYGSPRARVRQGDKEGVRMTLISNYYLRTVLEGVRQDEGQGEMVRLEIRLTQMVRREGETKEREVAILGPMKLSFQRDKYFPIGGPAIGNETMIIFLRVAK